MDLFDLALEDDAAAHASEKEAQARREAEVALADSEERCDILEWNMGRLLITAKTLLAQRDAQIAQLQTRLTELTDKRKIVRPNFVRYIASTNRLEMEFKGREEVSVFLRQTGLERNPGDDLPVILNLPPPVPLPPLQPKQEKEIRKRDFNEKERPRSSEQKRRQSEPPPKKDPPSKPQRDPSSERASGRELENEDLDRRRHERKRHSHHTSSSSSSSERASGRERENEDLDRRRHERKRHSHHTSSSSSSSLSHRSSYRGE